MGASSLVVVSPLGSALGFAPLPLTFFAVPVLMVVTYLAIVQLVKRRFYEASGRRAA
jgi:P-type Mg2+ transporter